jgi:hypothetical protein
MKSGDKRRMRLTSFLFLSVLVISCADPNDWVPPDASDGGSDSVAADVVRPDMVGDGAAPVPHSSDAPAVDLSDAAPSADQAGSAQDAPSGAGGNAGAGGAQPEGGRGGNDAGPGSDTSDTGVDLASEVAAPLGMPLDAVIMFDEGHEAWPDVAGSWARFATALTADGHTVKPAFTGPLTVAALQGVDILVIGTSWGAYTAAEIQTIEQFVNLGGKLFLTGLGWSWVDPAKARTIDNYPMNQIAAPFGIKFLASSICDPSNFDKDDCQPHFTVTGSHPITTGASLFGGGITPCALLALKPSVEAIVRGDSDSHDSSGTYKAGSNPPIVLYSPHGAGKVVALAHEGYLTTDDNDGDGTPNIDEHDNRRLGRNIIQFLAGYR